VRASAKVSSGESSIVQQSIAPLKVEASDYAEDMATESALTPTIVLAHGAGAGRSSGWMRYVAGALEARGARVVTFDFDYIAAGRKLPDKAPVLEARFVDVWREAAEVSQGPMIAAGKSMGGRIASMVASREGFGRAPDGLVFFGYPLHPPGKPAQRRDAHLPAITAPMLFVHGTKDPFGTPGEMEELLESLPSARLRMVDRGDHSLIVRRGQPVDDSVLDDVASWIRTLPESKEV
jgi:predicted alpha/beta-hydrolase family hydrolase